MRYERVSRVSNTVIINVSIDRVVRAKTLDAADVRAVRGAVQAAVQAHLVRATADTGFGRTMIRRVSRQVATEVTTRCSNVEGVAASKEIT